MIRINNRIPAERISAKWSLKVGEREIFRDAVFFDLEHYLFKEPICIGVFGAAEYDAGEGKLVSTQYMIENRSDASEILHLAKDYFQEMHDKGKRYIVTFSGNNDFLVINHLFQKAGIDFSFEDHFNLLDLQREYEVRFKKNIGLKNLERLYEIRRKGELISGITLAKTFSKIIKDPGYIRRMPPEKTQRILRYNEQDVVNLYRIMNHWEKVAINDVMTLEENILEEKEARRQQQEAEALRLKEKREQMEKERRTLDEPEAALFETLG